MTTCIKISLSLSEEEIEVARDFVNKREHRDLGAVKVLHRPCAYSTPCLLKVENDIFVRSANYAQ